MISQVLGEVRSYDYQWQIQHQNLRPSLWKILGHEVVMKTVFSLSISVLL